MSRFHPRPKQEAKKTSPAKPQKAKAARAKRQRIDPTRARVVEGKDLDKLFAKVRRGLNPVRDAAMLCLSYCCGLRAKEIAGLQWQRHILDATGKVGKTVHITESIAKRSVARDIPMNDATYAALCKLKAERDAELAEKADLANKNRKGRDKIKPEPNIFVIHALFSPYSKSKRAEDLMPGQCDPNTITQYLRRLYRDSGYVGCTSHSGRRTFGTVHARHCNEVGASLRDVQHLMGHVSLESTQAYVELSQRQGDLVSLLQPRL